MVNHIIIMMLEVSLPGRRRSFLDDLGAGEYTKDYFSEKRYEVFCNRGESTIFRSLEILIKRQERNIVPTDLN